MSSPWTKSLAERLRTVLEGGHVERDTFFRALSRRLDKAGPQLLHQVNRDFTPRNGLLNMIP